MARLRRHPITRVLPAAALACATVPGDAPRLVDVTTLAPAVTLDLRYATPKNFVGARIDGYEAARCLLTEPAAQALAAVDADLAAHDLGLVVWDCYRPQRAVDHFVRWSKTPADPVTAARHHPRVPKAELFARGYLAARSGHSRGSTVDVGLLRRSDGRALDCGTPFDFFDPSAHVGAAVAPPARRHRNTLAAAMERHGFAPYAAEWWHFTLRDEPYPDAYFDQVIR